MRDDPEPIVCLSVYIMIYVYIIDMLECQRQVLHTKAPTHENHPKAQLLLPVPTARAPLTYTTKSQ